MPIQTIKNGKLAWINITEAGEKEIEFLQKNFDFHKLDLADSHARKHAQRPKLNVYPNNIFLILLFPIYNRKQREISIGEIDCFMTADTLITIHNNNLPPLVKLFNYCNTDAKERQSHMSATPAFLLSKILSDLLYSCFPMLDHISIDINNIEKNIFRGQERKMVNEILVIKRNIVNFRRIMQAHKNIYKEVLSETSEAIDKNELRPYFTDLIDSVKNIWEIIENHDGTIKALEDTNSSLVSFKLNDIMRTLTIFSVIVFPLTLLAAIFGMNMQGTPLANHPYGFWIIICIMLTGSIIMFAFFRRKKWL